MTRHPVTVDVLGPIARVRLERPPGNRFALEVIDELTAAAVRLAAEPRVRVVRLTATGPDFSHGSDLFDDALRTLVLEEPEVLAQRGAALVSAWASLPMPTVADARGRIVGAGACLFLACDFRLAAPDSTLMFPEIDRGMHLSWGILPRLVRELGFPAARELALLGRPVPVGALRAGAVEVAVDAFEAAETLALALAEKPLLALRAILSQLRALESGRPFDLNEDARLFAQTLRSDDFAEAMTAWLEKRPGRYQDA